MELNYDRIVDARCLASVPVLGFLSHGARLSGGTRYRDTGLDDSPNPFVMFSVLDQDVKFYSRFSVGAK